MEGILREPPALKAPEAPGRSGQGYAVKNMSTRVVASFEGRIIAEVVLSKPITVVGRHPDCDIRFDHPAVSLRHALFRIVDRTVYLEDLASTNGTITNGIPTSSRVIHHLDLIQIGMHKLHVFDDARLTGSIGDLEQTILDASEMTMMVPGGGGAFAAPTLRPADPEDTDALGVTDPFLRVEPARPDAPSQQPAATAATAVVLALRAVGQGGEGEIITLDRPNTLIGKGGEDTALVVKRGKSLFLSQFAAHGRPRLNGRTLGPGAHEIGEHDRIEVGESVFEVIRATEESSWNM